jgi:transposase
MKSQKKFAVLLKNFQVKQSHRGVGLYSISTSYALHDFGEVVLKEKFRQIFERKKTNWLRALLRIGIWQKRAKQYFPDTVKTITNWFDEIIAYIAYFDNRTTSGIVEGINNKLTAVPAVMWYNK